MNKKQIVKVTIDGKEQYGICLDDSHLLLEKGTLLEINSNTYKTGVLNTYTGVPTLQYEEGRSIGNEVVISNTRNVPPELRAVMEQAYQAYVVAMGLNEKIQALTEQMKGCKEILSSMRLNTERARGLLQPEEFAHAFMDNLTGSVKGRIAFYAHRNEGYHGVPCPYRAEVQTYGDTPALVLSRHVDIKKYFRKASFIEEEYDGNIFLADNAEKDANYKRYVKEFSSPLGVRETFHEGLEVGGDKDYLSYYGYYELPLKKPLTEEYAKELAKAFCAEKTKKQTVER